MYYYSLGHSVCSMYVLGLREDATIKFRPLILAKFKEAYFS